MSAFAGSTELASTVLFKKETLAADYMSGGPPPPPAMSCSESNNQDTPLQPSLSCPQTLVIITWNAEYRKGKTKKKDSNLIE